MGDIGMLKGGLLAWLLWQGGVVGDVVVLSRINVGLGVYRRRRGRGETVNMGQTSITKKITRQNAVPGVS